MGLTPRPSRASLAALATLSLLATPLFVDATPLQKRLTEVDGFYNASASGGQWLTVSPPTFPFPRLLRAR